MVPEDGDDGNRDGATGPREDGSLLGEPVSRQVTGEQHEVGLLRDLRERPFEALAEGLDCVDISCCGDANGCGHETSSTRHQRSANAESGYHNAAMTSATKESVQMLVTTMKHAAAALRQADVEFMLGGGLAAWARGGPPTDHDVDFYVRERDAQRALDALVEAGLRPEQPPEEWLYKAYDGPVLVDLIFRPAGGASETSTSSGRPRWRSSPRPSSSPRSTTCW